MYASRLELSVLTQPRSRQYLETHDARLHGKLRAQNSREQADGDARQQSALDSVHVMYRMHSSLELSLSHFWCSRLCGCELERVPRTAYPGGRRRRRPHTSCFISCILIHFADLTSLSAGGLATQAMLPP